MACSREHMVNALHSKIARLPPRSGCRWMRLLGAGTLVLGLSQCETPSPAASESAGNTKAAEKAAEPAPELPSTAVGTPSKGGEPATAARACDPDGRCWTAHESSTASRLCIAGKRRESAFTVRVDAARRRPPLKLQAKSEPFVMVDAVPCLSSSCSRNVTHTCTVASRGTEHVLTTSYRYETTSDGWCTEDCRTATAVCRLPPLEPGRHTLRAGDKTLTIEVPGTLPEPCLELE